MSNKKETAAMTTAAEEGALVPKLRFPEFRDAGEWKEKALSELGNFFRGITYSAKEVVEDGLLVLRSSNIQDGALVLHKDLVFIDKTCPNDIKLKDGDILICMSNGSKALVGKSAEYHGNYEGNLTVGAFCSIFRSSIKFSKLIFQSEKYRRFISVSIGGGNINNLKNSDLEEFKHPIPKLASEQQKIADCLASVDELITLESQKLDRLKLYKKGLMQQLFPTEGETVPRLRFPEFQGTNEWDINGLGTLTTFVNEKISIVQISLENYISTENILQDYGGITKASKLPETGSVTQFRSNDILFSNIRPYLKKVWLADKKGGASNDVIVIRAKQEIEAKFLSFLLKNDTFINYVMTGAKGVKMPRGDIESMKKYPTPFPLRAEQQKIAECLTSIDECITAQNQKIETLKTHKKGLMQQLFPAPDGFSSAQAGNT